MRVRWTAFLVHVHSAVEVSVPRRWGHKVFRYGGGDRRLVSSSRVFHTDRCKRQSVERVARDTSWTESLGLLIFSLYPSSAAPLPPPPNP